jgi:hypothetical protein
MYVLYNKTNKAYLEHPRVGLWVTENKEEADDMLQACHAYLVESGLEFLVSSIKVVELGHPDFVPVDPTV